MHECERYTLGGLGLDGNVQLCNKSSVRVVCYRIDDLIAQIAAVEARAAKAETELATLRAKMPREPFDVRCADALADEVAVLVRRGVLDARSPAGDALLDYRNPPSSPRVDRLVELEKFSKFTSTAHEAALRKLPMESLIRVTSWAQQERNIWFQRMEAAEKEVVVLGKTVVTQEHAWNEQVEELAAENAGLRERAEAAEAARDGQGKENITLRGHVRLLREALASIATQGECRCDPSGRGRCNMHHAQAALEATKGAP